MVKPPLCLFKVKDKLLTAHPFVFTDKQLKVLPKRGDGTLGFGEFSYFVEGEVFE